MFAMASVISAPIPGPFDGGLAPAWVLLVMLALAAGAILLDAITSTRVAETPSVHVVHPRRAEQPPLAA